MSKTHRDRRFESHATTLTRSPRPSARGLHNVAIPRQPAAPRPAARLIELADGSHATPGLRDARGAGGTDYLGYPGRTRWRFEVHYVLRNLATAELLVVKAGVDDPDPMLPSVYRALAGRRLDGARGLRHVRNSLPGPSRPASNPDARGVRSLSPAQGLPLAGTGRAAQFPPAFTRGIVNHGGLGTLANDDWSVSPWPSASCNTRRRLI